LTRAVRAGEAADSPVVFTLGHSNHPQEHLLGLLARHEVGAVADVRSVPWSRRNPQFSRPRLAAALAERGVGYVFLGRELGARAADPALYREGRVDFARLAASAPFRAGLAQLLAAARAGRICALCAEREPLDCHRTLLVARELERAGARVAHILADGTLEPHADTERRLLALTGLAPPPLLDSAEARAEALARAYAVRGREIAYRSRDLAAPPPDVE
jgi:uncharacterized protein (DUF488 family)